MGLLGNGSAVAVALNVIALVAGASSCRPMGYVSGVYHGDGFAFRVGEPGAGWRPLAVSQAAIAYRVDADDATIAANGRCRLDSEDVPLASLTQHLFLRFTERQIERQETVPFDGREAMHTVMSAKLDGVPMKFDVWVLKKDGCVYDLFYMVPPERYGRGSPDYARFVQGFATVSQ